MDKKSTAFPRRIDAAVFCRAETEKRPLCSFAQRASSNMDGGGQPPKYAFLMAGLASSSAPVPVVTILPVSRTYPRSATERAA